MLAITMSLFASSVRVSVISPTPATSNSEMNAEGIVVPKNKTALTAKTTGIVTFLISNNANVHAGETIAKIVDQRREKKLKFLKIKLQLLEKQHALQNKKLHNDKAKYTLGIGSKNNYLNEQVGLEQIEASIQSVKNEYDTLLLEDKNSVIVAKNEGFITNLLAQNTYVSYGMFLGNFSTKDSQVKLFVDAKYAKNMIKGLPVKLTSSYANTKGIVSNILFQSSNNLLEVMVDLKTNLPLNSNVTATLALNKIDGFLIPKASVVLVDNHPAIYIIKKNTAHLVFIDILKDRVNTVVIKKSIPLESQIALKNAYMLHDNLAVSIE